MIDQANDKPITDNNAELNLSRLIRGTWLCPHPTKPIWESYEDAILRFDERGVIVELIKVEDWSRRFPHVSLPQKANPNGVWLPGFVDTHVHYPQTAIIGSASGPLLDWLATSVFPEEAKFAQKKCGCRVVAQR